MNKFPRPANLPASNHFATRHRADLEAEARYLYSRLAIVPAFAKAVDFVTNRAQALRSSYRGFIAPWWFVAAIHNLEGGQDLRNQILNGQEWDRVTTIVPKGKGPFASFRESTEFALKDFSSPEGYPGLPLDKLDWNDPGEVAFALEAWNGFGYRLPIAAATTPPNADPYLWSGGVLDDGSPVYMKGKLVSDNTFDPEAVSEQVGGMVFLKALEASGEKVFS